MGMTFVSNGAGSFSQRVSPPGGDNFVGGGNIRKRSRSNAGSYAFSGVSNDYMQGGGGGDTLIGGAGATR